MAGEIITNFVGALILVYFIKKNANRRWTGILDVCISSFSILLYFGLVSLMNFLFHFEGYLGLFVYGAACMLLGVILVNMPLAEYLSMGITWAGITLCTSLFAASTLQLIVGGEMQELLLFANREKWIAYIVNILAKYILVTITVRIRAVGHKSTIDNLIFCILFLVISIVCMSIFRYENMIENRPFGDNFAPVMATILLLLLFIMLYYSMRIGNLVRQEEEKKLLGVTSEKQSSELLLTAEKINELRQFQHDTDKAIHTFKILLADEKYDEAKAYITQYENLFRDMKVENVYTGIPIVDAVIGTRQTVMREHDIQFSCVIHTSIPEKLILSFAIILTNLLDNAIEAECEEEQRREVRLAVTKIGSYISVRVENSIAKSVIDRNKDFMSTKNDRDKHGYGMKSIEFHCKRHGGFNGITEENGYFIHEAMMKL